MADSSPSRRVISPTDQSALILILALFLMATFIMSVIGRVAVRYGKSRSMAVDDWAICLATLLGVAQSIGIAVATNSGLGKAEDLLSSAEISNVIKALYASDYFFIAAVGCSKASVLSLLRKLVVSKMHQKVCLYTIYYVGVWSVASILTVGVRCGARAPWDLSGTRSCVNVRTVWIAISPFDIISEVVIMGLPMLMMVPVQVPLSKKVFVVAAFCSRALFVTAVIARLCYLRLDFSTNFTLRETDAVYATQTVLCVAIVTACIPAMKPLMEAFNSGGMNVRVKESGTGSHSNSHHGFKMASLSKSRIYAATPEDGSPSDLSRNGEARVQPLHDHTADQYVTRKMSHGTDGDHDSISSQARSEQMIIRKNVEWTVKYEEGHDFPAKK